MSKPLLATKLKNQLEAIAPDIVTHLKNVRINIWHSIELRSVLQEAEL